MCSLSRKPPPHSFLELTGLQLQIIKVNTPFDLESLRSGSQQDYALMQGSISPMGMDRSESFMDAETDLVDMAFSEHNTTFRP